MKRYSSNRYGAVAINRHNLTVRHFPNEGPIFFGSGYGSTLEVGRKGASKRMIKFVGISSDILEMVQGVRVCVGGIQYREFLTEIKNRAEKEAAERKALEED
jgi:hypothetical protein